MTTDARLLTAEEFMLLPDSPDGGKMELVDGEVVRMAPAGGEHGRRAASIAASLLQFIKEHELGDAGVEVGYRLRRSPDLVYAPDVAFSSRERLPGGRFPNSFVDGAPTLAVEVVSPNDSSVEVDLKVEQYLRAGTERVWVVQPTLRSVRVHYPNGSSHRYQVGDTLTSAEAGFGVDGFILPVAEIFV